MATNDRWNRIGTNKAKTPPKKTRLYFGGESKVVTYFFGKNAFRDSNLPPCNSKVCAFVVLYHNTSPAEIDPKRHPVADADDESCGKKRRGAKKGANLVPIPEQAVSISIASRKVVVNETRQ